jgi:hypothetical protein
MAGGPPIRLFIYSLKRPHTARCKGKCVSRLRFRGLRRFYCGWSDVATIVAGGPLAVKSKPYLVMAFICERP